MRNKTPQQGENSEYKTKLKESTEELYGEMDGIIIKLLQARLDHNESAERTIHILMEGMIVQAMQQLRCLIDYLEKEEEK